MWPHVRDVKADRRTSGPPDDGVPWSGFPNEGHGFGTWWDVGAQPHSAVIRTAPSARAILEAITRANGTKGTSLY